MFMVIPTWEVVVRGMGTFRVPETNLDQFLHVLTFNKREFDVRSLKEDPQTGVQSVEP